MLQITIACWDYDRVRAIIDGRVQIEGCDINFLPMGPEECFFRAYINKEFDVSEIGFCPYITAQSAGGTPYIAIPAFVSRTFRHSAIYIRTDRGIKTPADLKGKRIGVPEYQMSASMWARGMLKDEYGVDYTTVKWFQGGLEQPGREDKFQLLHLPKDFPLFPIPTGKTLASMLGECELDAILSARAPSCFRDGHPMVRRLFEDYAEAERAYFKRAGIFPIMHAVGIRRDVNERHPWLASAVYKAFIAAKAIAQAELDEVGALKVMLPWVTSEAQKTRALMGNDFWPYGIEENRKTLETMVRYCHEQGLMAQLMPIEHLFAPSTVRLPKV